MDNIPVSVSAPILAYTAPEVRSSLFPPSLPFNARADLSFPLFSLSFFSVDPEEPDEEDELSPELDETKLRVRLDDRSLLRIHANSQAHFGATRTKEKEKEESELCFVSFLRPWAAEKS